MANATGDVLDGMFSAFSLDWEVLSEEGTPSDASVILPYLIDNILHDEDGLEIGSEPRTIDSLQTYAGKKWLWM
jgi:hypothetical protein